MYSEPTISPNFVVRQKRKLSRHPLIIGGIVCMMLLAIGGLISSLGSGSPSQSVEDEPVIRFESSIIYEATPDIVMSPEPEDDTPIVLVNTSEIVQDEESTTASLDAPIQAQCRISTSGDTNVNIRSGPDLTFSLIGSLSNRETVDAIAVSDNRWFQILNSDGTIGWVGGSVVDEQGDCNELPIIATPVCSIENTTGNRVNIRDRATTQSNIIRVLSPDDLLMADGRTTDGWYRIYLTREIGWIFEGVIALGDGCTNTPIISAEEPTPQPVIFDSNINFDSESCVIESFTGATIDLRNGPGMEFSVVAKLNKAMAASRLSSNGWYEIEGFGWAFAGDLVYSGICNVLPTVSPEDIHGSQVVMSSG